MKNYTVSQVNQYIKQLLQQDFLLSGITVSGEASNCKYHSSGHLYFTLKDAGGQLACVMFAREAARLSFRLREGQRVLVTGTVGVYERDGKYQLYATRIQDVGVGALYEQYAQRKAKLEAEGLFDPNRKRQLPLYATRIGIVTALTGAAIQDIVSIAKRRNPYCSLVLCPAQVQGAGAAESIVRALSRLARTDVEVIICGRGGGSIEDLWAFNEEIVARAIAACPVPVISAVGHQTDVTIADFAADLRAPTPSAAAELAIYEVAQVDALLVDAHSALLHGMLARIAAARGSLEQERLRLRMGSPRGRLRQRRQLLVDLEEELRGGMKERLMQRRQLLALFGERLRGLSPLKTIGQGYSYVTDEAGHTVRRVAQVQAGDRLTIRVSDGVITARVMETEANPKTES